MAQDKLANRKACSFTPANTTIITPFPKVPLGWRSVKLQWDDGYWWFSKVGCKWDWWKLRYW
jgi:hypothetical protein